MDAGTRIGPYDVVSSLGAGGMGEVYRTTDTNLKRQVAIKVLPPAVVSDIAALAPRLLWRHVGGRRLDARVDLPGVVDSG